MRKIYALIASLALPVMAWAEGASVPFSSSLYGDDSWSIVNGLEGSRTWVPETGTSYSFAGASGGVKYTYDSSNPGDDWYISPAVHFEKGKEYKVRYWEKASGSKECYKLFLAQKNDTASLRAGATLVTRESITGNTAGSKQAATFTVEETGDYYFAYYVYSPKNAYYLYLAAFSVAENVLSAGAPTDFTATADASEAVSVALSWKAPTTDLDGVDLPEGTTITSYEITRDGEVVATVAGTETSYTDDVSKGLTGGVHTYGISAFLGTVKGEQATAKTGYVGPVAAVALPWNADLSSADDIANRWIIVKGEQSGSANGWQYKTSSYSGNSLQYYCGSGKVEDDWLITPPLKFEKAGTYRLRLNATYSNNSKCNVVAYLGSGKDVSNYTDSIGIYTSVPTSKTDVDVVYEVKTPGEYRVALHACAKSSTYTTFYIYGMSVVQVVTLPDTVSGLKATPDPDLKLKATIEWTNPTKTNTEGVEVTTLTKAVIIRNGERVDSISEGLEPGKVSTYVDNNVPDAGIYTYSVEVYNENGKSETAAPVVTTTWIGAGKNVPYTADYADWVIFNVNKDTNTWGDEITWNKNSAGDRVNIMSNNNTPDDWVISPRINFEAGKTYIIKATSWTGYDGEPPYAWELAYGSLPEPTGMTTLTTFNTTVKNLADAQTDSIEVLCVLPNDSVEAAEGDDVKVGLTIPSGVRTLGFHAVNTGAVYVGAFTITVKPEIPTGVDGVKAEDAVVVAGDKVNFASAANVVVSDLSGKTVIVANGVQSVDLSTLSAGLYIVSAKVAGKQVAIKVVK